MAPETQEEQYDRRLHGHVTTQELVARKRLYKTHKQGGGNNTRCKSRLFSNSVSKLRNASILAGRQKIRKQTGGGARGSNNKCMKLISRTIWPPQPPSGELAGSKTKLPRVRARIRTLREQGSQASPERALPRIKANYGAQPPLQGTSRRQRCRRRSPAAPLCLTTSACRPSPIFSRDRSVPYGCTRMKDNRCTEEA